MKKIDYKRELKQFYAPSSKEISVVEVPSMNYLMIDGKGDPNTSQEYRGAVETLFAVAYSIKFAVKKGRQQIDYGVMPLEGLWWVPEMKNFSVEQKRDWLWTMMIMQPDIISSSTVDEAIDSVRKKKGPSSLYKIRFGAINEGASAQVLYFGPYADEGSTIASIHDFIAEKKYACRGKHHEIYLNDPRRTVPQKLKTIIRQPLSILNL